MYSKLSEWVLFINWKYVKEIYEHKFNISTFF